MEQACVKGNNISGYQIIKELDYHSLIFLN
jgi:hypothetical protein